MRIPFVPSLPGPAGSVARRWLADEADATAARGALAGRPAPTVASGAGSGASSADPRLATPPLRVAARPTPTGTPS